MRAAVRLKKPAAGFPARAHDENCDDKLMPVFCPTAQDIFSLVFAEAFSVKTLHRRRGFSSCNRLGRFDRRRRTHLGRRLLLGCGGCLSLASNPRARRRAPTSPGMRNRGSCRVTDKRAGHRTDRSQHDRSRYGAQRSTSRALLSARFEREQRSSDHRRNKRSLHRYFLEPSATQGTAKIRRHKGDVAAATARFKKPAAGSRRGLKGCDAEDVPVICPTCQMPFQANSLAETRASRPCRVCHRIRGSY